MDSHKNEIYHGSLNNGFQENVSAIEFNHPDYKGDISWKQIISKDYSMSNPDEKLLDENSIGNLEKIAIGDFGQGDTLYGGNSVIIRALPGDFVFGRSYVTYEKKEKDNEKKDNDKDEGWYYEFEYEVLPDLDKQRTNK